MGGFLGRLAEKGRRETQGMLHQAKAACEGDAGGQDYPARGLPYPILCLATSKPNCRDQEYNEMVEAMARDIVEEIFEDDYTKLRPGFALDR